MKDLFEIVPASKLDVGDWFAFVLAGVQHIVQIKRVEFRNVENITFHFDRDGFIKFPRYQPVFRRIPAGEDPRILRRAVEKASWHDPSPMSTVDRWIREAIEELERETTE